MAYRDENENNTIEIFKEISIDNYENKEIFSKKSIEFCYSLLEEILYKYPAQWECWGYIHKWFSRDLEVKYNEPSEIITKFNEYRYSLFEVNGGNFIFDLFSCTSFPISKEILTAIQNLNFENLNVDLVKELKEKTDTKHQVIFANPNYKNINLGSEIGKKFSLGDNKPSFLTDFKFFIKDNNFEMVKFRINVYNIKDNKPNIKINQSNIIVQVDNKLTDWINVDLSQFDITVQEDIIITVEWIEHSKGGNKLNLPIVIPSFGSTHYYKFGS